METMIISKERARLNIAENLRRLMDARGMTQTQLADAAGISQPFVHKLLHAKINPNAADLRNVAEVLGTTSDTMLENPAETISKKTA
jgi:transcriptional regulator with XRE-family HTH domain